MNIENQQINTDEIILPKTFYEKRFLFYKTNNFIKVFSTKIEINFNKISDILYFSEIQNISWVNGKIKFILTNGKTYQYESSIFDSNFMNFLHEIYSEYKKWRTYKSSKLGNVKEIISLINEIFSLKVEPCVRSVDFLLEKLVELEVSDIHFEPIQDNVRITIRQGRVIIEIGSIKSSYYKSILARIKYLAGCLTQVISQPQEGSWTFDNERGIDVRISVFPSLFGERLALRFIRPIRFADLDSLGWDKKTIFAWRELLRSKNGLLLIVGSAGSGKTTTLYASLAEIASGKIYNTPNSIGSVYNSLHNQLFTKRVISIEDPVEAKIPNICQTSLSSYINLTLTDAFKCILRQDPDVIALGEIRDAKCLKEVLQAALSGHLILATFHAASVEAAIERIKQMTADTEVVLSGLLGILSVEWDKNEKINPTNAIIEQENQSLVNKNFNGQNVVIAKINHSSNKKLESNLDIEFL